MLMRPFIPVGLRTETYLPFRVPGYGLIIALFALTLLGFLTANLVGRTLVEFGENLLNRMPIVRPIYKTMKQIFETLFSKSGSSFRKVGAGRNFRPACGRWCSCRSRRARTSRRGCRATSTCRLPSCRARPTRPPASSSTCRAPRIIELDISVEQAMTLICRPAWRSPTATGRRSSRRWSRMAARRAPRRCRRPRRLARRDS